jgi:hypothetical protein
MRAGLLVLELEGIECGAVALLRILAVDLEATPMPARGRDG